MGTCNKKQATDAKQVDKGRGAGGGVGKNTSQSSHHRVACIITYFRVALASLSKRGLEPNLSYENEFNLHVNETSFS